MKIFLAGNTPNRLQEEKSLAKKGYLKNRLFSYFFIIDSSMRDVFGYWGIK